MQLTRPIGSVRRGLMAASCALLGAAGAGAQEAPGLGGRSSEGDWQVDSGVLYYRENQGRVTTIEPVVNVAKDFGDDHVLGVTFAYDSLTGGSPNGALPSRLAQTFATPSGTSLQPVSGVPQTYTTSSGKVVAKLEKVTLYTVEPGRTPLDPNFRDRRIAGDASWSQPFGDAGHVSFAAHLSDELDFKSGGLSTTFSHDFDSHNTTLSAGVNGEFDSIEPIGGTPEPGSDYVELRKGGKRTKHVLGGLVGLTQVMNRRWVAQLNYTYDRSNGYLTDPYKIVSVLDATGLVDGYRFESRPQARTRQSVYVGNKVALGRTALDLSVRAGRDDWGSHSTTVDAHWHVNLGRDWYVEPHVRAYRQTAADFYHLYLDGTAPLPAFASADPRLADFKAQTYGFKVGWTLDERSEVSLRLEQYRQTPSVRSSSLAQLQGLDLNPGLRSLIVQIGWRYAF